VDYETLVGEAFMLLAGDAYGPAMRRVEENYSKLVETVGEEIDIDGLSPHAAAALLFSFSQGGRRNGLKIASQLWKSRGVYDEIEDWFDTLDEPVAQVIARYFNGERWHY
jgi:hypothetical protein